MTVPRAKAALAPLADKMRSERGQGTVEYAVVLAGVLCMVVALGVLAKAMGEGLFVEHALMSASHHLQLAALGSVADVFAFYFERCFAKRLVKRPWRRRLRFLSRWRW